MNICLNKIIHFLSLNYWYSQRLADDETIRRSKNKPKIILYWNNYFNHSDMGFGIGQEPFQKAGCKVSNCIATSDRDLLKQSDAVIIHAGDYSENDLPTYRSPHQRFVFFNLETLPGMRHLPCFSRRHFYNWTMTYRRDSDIYDARPYGALWLRILISLNVRKTNAVAIAKQ